MSAASQDELELHHRLVNGDETASAEVFERYLTPLIEELCRYYQSVANRDRTLISDAVTEALFNYVEQPSNYDPSRASLRGYLKMSADGDLRNLLEKEKRREKPKESLDKIVELRGGVRKRNQTGKALEGKEIEAHIEEIVSDEADREVVEMMLDGVRKTERYAEVLGIDHLPIEEQRTKVKRAKDRLKKKLQRADWEGFIDLEE